MDLKNLHKYLVYLYYLINEWILNVFLLPISALQSTLHESKDDYKNAVAEHYVQTLAPEHKVQSGITAEHF